MLRSGKMGRIEAEEMEDSNRKVDSTPQSSNNQARRPEDKL
jgi:hypothetical protein